MTSSSGSVGGTPLQPHLPAQFSPLKAEEEQRSITLLDLLKLYEQLYGPKDGPQKFKDEIMDPMNEAMQGMLKEVKAPEIKAALQDFISPPKQG